MTPLPIAQVRRIPVLAIVASLLVISGCAESGGAGGAGAGAASGSGAATGATGASAGALAGPVPGGATGNAGGVLTTGGSAGGSTSGGASRGSAGSSSGGSAGGGAGSVVPAMRVTAWLPSWAGAGGRQSVTDSLGALDEINPCWYTLNADGSLKPASGFARDRAFVATMHARGTQVLPMVDDFAINGATPVLTDAAKRARLLQALIDEVVAYDLDGVDIDFEGMGTAGRDPFSSFMADLSREMHTRGKLLSTAVYPKTSEPGQYSTGRSHDYVALGRVVDELKIMLYSFDGPVAPLTYIDSVCTFAKSVAPPEKVYAGIPFYGWDKPATGTKRAVTETGAEALRAQVGATKSRHAASQEATFTYTDASSILHTVFYQDATAIGAKCDRAKALGLGGVSIWRMGGETKPVWDAIRARR